MICAEIWKQILRKVGFLTTVLILYLDFVFTTAYMVMRLEIILLLKNNLLS
jgi:hypothetical protein